MTTFVPRLEILPPAQRRLWMELGQVPDRWVLYGGTAIALWLGHRTSEDFDFFSSAPFEPGALLSEIPFLTGAIVRQTASNTLTVTVERNGPVKVSFFGGLHIGRVGVPSTADPCLAVASVLDLAGTKAAVVQQRAESKDYRDIAELLRRGVALPQMLGAAQALYGESFNPLVTLKALSYYADGDLPSLSREDQQLLTRAAAGVDAIPEIHRLGDRISPHED